ncbi:alpha/beta fold hydrolase [Brevibacillus ruminantium]|uniref:Alpha/beta fold hydrolase n=1 Tax=Brevibacillus ruminantium TaxID=2950604 RepID=A0ABY4WQW7_9BACL|nr:alpha/beta fold hydrolase [Brevibacillus ruminantium]USG68260.1 alpha/beta fold hydrolase [Brevibacillus ruminantium]
MSRQTDAVHSFQAYLSVGSAYSPKIVPHRGQITFISKKSGLPQLWYKNDNESSCKQYVVMPDSVMKVSHSPAGDKTILGMDWKGNEKQQLYLINNETRKVRELMVSPEHFHHLGGWSPCGTKITWSSNRRTAAFFDVFVQDVDTGQTDVVYRFDGRTTPDLWLPDGRRLLVRCLQGNNLQALHVLDLDTGGTTRIGFEQLGRYESIQMTKAGDFGYMVSDAAEDTMALYRFTLHGEPIKLVHFPKWDIEEAKLSLDETRIAYTVNEGGISVLYLYNVASGKSEPLKEIPRGVIDSISWFDDNRIVFGLKSPVIPGEIFRYDVCTRSLERLTYFSEQEGGGPSWREPELSTFVSFDGLDVPYFFYRQERANSPAVVYVHGGPESQSRYDFNSVIQYLYGQGFSVFVPNVRGSKGYGKHYMDLDNGRKRMDAVADLAALAKEIGRIGSIDSGKIGIIGRSYGGFMVLAALTHYPHLWAAGVDIVGISHFRTFLENTGPWRRKLREVEYGTLAEDSDFFEEIAPLNLSHKIQAPLLIFHGKNDTRVPVSEAEQMYADMKARGQQVELIVFEDEGHKTEKIENHIRMNEAIASFFRHHLSS